MIDLSLEFEILQIMFILISIAVSFGVHLFMLCFIDVLDRQLYYAKYLFLLNHCVRRSNAQKPLLFWELNVRPHALRLQFASAFLPARQLA